MDSNKAFNNGFNEKYAKEDLKPSEEAKGIRTAYRYFKFTQ